MEVNLACGADMNHVWDNATQPPTEHEVECPGGAHRGRSCRSTA